MTGRWRRGRSRACACEVLSNSTWGVRPRREGQQGIKVILEFRRVVGDEDLQRASRFLVGSFCGLDNRGDSIAEVFISRTTTSVMNGLGHALLLAPSIQLPAVTANFSAMTAGDVACPAV